MGCLKLTYNQYDTTLKVVYKKIDFEQNIVQRFLSLDPLMDEFPWMSPFVGMDNNPISLIDPLGLSTDGPGDGNGGDKKNTITIKTDKPIVIKKQELPESKLSFWKRITSKFKQGLKRLKTNLFNFSETKNKGTKSKTSFAWLRNVNLSGFNFGSDRVKGGSAFYDNISEQSEYTQERWRYYRKQGETLDKVAAGMLLAPVAKITAVETVPAWAPYAWNAATHPFIAATGRYGAMQKILAFYQIGNFIGDATFQIMNVTINEEKWNYGSTIGNLYISNPFTSAIPGAINNLYYNPKDYLGVFSSYTLDVGGNFIGDAFMNSKFLTPGAKLGLGGYTIPMIWNLNPILNK
jgi:hypothetical protein